MTLTIYTNRTVSLDGEYVGRIDRDSYLMPSGYRKGETTFFTASGDLEKTGYDVPHKMNVSLYVPAIPGSRSNWKVNPDFEASVRQIVETD